MFWGLIMEPNKRYTQTVEKAFHLSMASLDASTASESLVQVMICYDNRNYLLCTLEKGSVWQVPLDLNFQEGTKIAFTCNGDGHVHLTGYLIPEDEGLDEFDDLEDEEEEVPQLVGPKKRKALSAPKEGNDLKRPKKVGAEDEDDDDDDESDSDNEDGGLEFDDDSDEDLDGEEDGEDDDEDDSDDESDEDDKEEESTPVKPQKKQKQKQKQQQQQNQPNHQQNQNQQQSKKDKSKMMNGKDGKQEQGKQKKNDSKTEEKSEQQQQQKKRTIEGGVQVEDIKVGNGPPAKPGKFISVYYIGRLKSGKKFDATQQGEGFKFRLGKGEVIKGWDIGINGMKVGGKRRIVIPPHMAYGAKGSPPIIPPNSLLNFEVELKAVN